MHYRQGVPHSILFLSILNFVSVSCFLQSTSQYFAPFQVSSALSTCFPKDCHFCCPLTDSLWLSGSILVIIKMLSAYWGTWRAEVVSYNFLVPQQTFRKRLVLNIPLTIYFGISQIDLKSWCCSFWVNLTELPLGILALLDITWLYSPLGFLPLLWLVLLGFPWGRPLPLCVPASKRFWPWLCCLFTGYLLPGWAPTLSSSTCWQFQVQPRTLPASQTCSHQGCFCPGSSELPVCQTEFIISTLTPPLTHFSSCVL